MSLVREFYTCTKCGETWECRMSTTPIPCSRPGVQTCGEVRPATIDEIEDYERMFVDW